MPLLLLQKNSLVKSVQFSNHRIVGDAVSTIKLFSRRYADEMLILDIDSKTRGEPNFELLKRISPECNMPLTFGGGINTFSKASEAFKCGADKIAVNSLFYENRSAVSDLVDKYGGQSIVLSLDVKKSKNGYSLYCSNGSISWAEEDLQSALKIANELGVGEILVNSIDNDGVMGGFDNELVSLARNSTDLPLIIAGGCSSKEDCLEAFNIGVDAIAAGSIFHWIGESIVSLKQYLDRNGIEVRMV